MSLARAYIDCMRCHELGQIKTSTDSLEDRLYQLRVKDKQHKARRRATEELETMGVSVSGHPGYILVKDTNHFDEKQEKWLYEASRIKGNGLTACLTCDYTRPSLAQYLKANTTTISALLQEQEPSEISYNYRTNAKPK